MKYIVHTLNGLAIFYYFNLEKRCYLKLILPFNERIKDNKYKYEV